MSKLRVDLERVSHRVLDGEAVLIHSGTQRYYALNRSGTLVWLVLLEGETGVEAVARRVADVLGEDVARDDAPALSEGIAALLEALRKEEILVEQSGAPASPLPFPEDFAPGAWETPQLERYEELQRLIVCGE